MNIGKLNRRVEILEFITHRDEYGGEVGEWKSVARVWASITPVSGTEYYQSQTVNAETVIKVTMRYNPRIDVMNRLRYQGKIYEIIGVADELTAHRATVLNCKEMVNHELQRKAEKSQGRSGGCERPCQRPESDGGCCGGGTDEGG